VPTKLVLGGSFGADSRITVKSSADISMINAHVTGIYDKQSASARARFWDRYLSWLLVRDLDALD
jgi:hypothetical protein